MIKRFLNWLLDSNKPKPDYIDEKIMEECLQASKSKHPNEHLVLLSAKKREDITIRTPNTKIDDDKYVITNYYIAPNTKSTPQSASFNPNHLPNTEEIVGSFHSHPSNSNKPSPEDANLFSKYPINIITHYPYTKDTTTIYDSEAKPTTLTPIDVKQEKDPIEKDIENIDNL